MISDDGGFVPTQCRLGSRRQRPSSPAGRVRALRGENSGEREYAATSRRLQSVRLALRGTGNQFPGRPGESAPVYREALQKLFAWFDSVGGINGRQYLTGISDPTLGGDFDGSLRSPAVDEWSLGYLVQMTSGAVRLDYVARDWKHFYAARVDTTTGQREDSFGNTVDVVRVVNDDSGTERTYRALQLQGSWQRGSLSAGGGYTLSSLRGNDDEDDGLNSAAPRNLPLALWYPEFLGYARRRPIGFLSQDERHRANVWLTWRNEFGRGALHVSLLQRFNSGTPYSAVGSIDPAGRSTPFDGVPANPGYALNRPATAPLFTSANAVRFGPMTCGVRIWTLDASLAVAFGHS